MSGFWPDGRRAAVSLTFDDARYTQPDRGLPLLARYDTKATFYVSLDRARERHDGWRKAVAAGHEIGNHTLSHPCSGNFAFARENAVEDYTLERMEAEIVQASGGIEDLLGVTPETFAYPCGQTFVGRGENTVSYVPLIARHFLAGRGYYNGVHNAPEFCDLSQLAATSLDDPPAEAIVSAIVEAVNQGTWLILCGHEIGGEGPEPLNTSLEKLEIILGYLREHSDIIWTNTLAQVARYVREHRGRNL